MDHEVSGRCPKDQGILVENAGALGEDICRRCQSRFMNADITFRLFCELLSVREEHLHGLAKEGFQKWPCPACASKMTTTWVRGLEVEICSGCGGSFLDAGELARLGDALVSEVKVENQDESVGLHGFIEDIQVGVFCVHCDEQIEITNSNWLIEGRPWCAGCAAPYVGFMSRVLAPIRFVGVHLLNFIGDMGLAGGRQSDFSQRYGVPVLVDSLRVSPGDAAELYSPFFEILPRRQPHRREGNP